MCTSTLDLLGVLLIGLVGALAVTTIQSQPPPEAVQRVADTLGLNQLSDQELVLAFAGMAAALLLAKSIVSSVMTRRIFIFLANRQALVSARLSKELLSRPLTFIQERSSQETAFALITGAGAATSTILGQLVIAATEAALLVVLGVALLFLSPWVALGSIAFFTLVAFGLQRSMGNWASRVGSIAATADIASLNSIQEAISAYREISVVNRREIYVDRIQKLRWEAARSSAETQFIGLLPKYIFEAALVIGGLSLALFLFATQDSVVAVGTLTLFLAAGTRVMPSLLRLQSAFLGLRSASGSAAPTFDLALELGNPTTEPSGPPDFTAILARLRAGHGDFDPNVMVESISVLYPGASQPALTDVTLQVPAGSSVALVGRSGAGKSTLADAILGLVSPNSGSVTVSGCSPSEAISRWPGAVAYVPQEVALANDSVRANVALGLPTEAIDDAAVWDALDRAHLSAFLRSSRNGLDTYVGEGGVRLSGGQRQRLGIARALYTRPRMLILDEATSALDAETEEAIASMIRGMEGHVTLVLIAHRLSTVRNVDKVIYMDGGVIAAEGSFEEVALQLPSFARQVRLMGLSAQDS